MFTQSVVRKFVEKSLLKNNNKLLKFLCYSTSSNNFVRPVYYDAKKFEDKVAIQDDIGRHTFSDIYQKATTLSKNISSALNQKTGERVLFLCPNDVSYVITLWAIWMSGQIAVPLSPLHPDSLLLYYTNDTNSALIVSSSNFQPQMEHLATASKVPLYVLPQTITEPSKLKSNVEINEDIIPNTNEAMILYTSGTTGSPKGVVLTHKNLRVQVETLTSAWKWTSNDVILHTLPLHHVHGTINALFCPLYVGATTIMLPKFNPTKIWNYFLQNKEKITVFMAVPTIYSKLIDEYENNIKNKQKDVRKVLENDVRLMVSGSAPLPAPVHTKWFELSGHKLLERYGMTEIGMCLSNLYDSDRSPGFVGVPLPSVSVALADQNDGTVILQCSNQNGSLVYEKNGSGDVTGELLVKGDSVFKEYFGKPEATRKEFINGWFKTGDLAQFVEKDQKFRILGRKSVDIIKSGGYKISALQIETLLLEHERIKECAVLGVPDDVYGERVGVIVVPQTGGGSEFDLEGLRGWAGGKMPRYWVPSVLRVVEEIPKNAMGKVNKKELIKVFFD
ncbi:malonate--CoA ligase ACSF3, mitochondrial-like [Sitophilus oryzae]|uniref:Malonate--CoA ligase ACSF3, mitochondrial-like n=1 Tax=Sitophilus oryzae TaxID=7048 RepID=A0A6J2XIR9_SITOR|nr:malonate--CoA ligase ACSF3, mitochondrial-like [Sitophilus oryzae]